MNKFKPEGDDQLWLLPPSLDDFVTKDHLARVVKEVVEFLDVRVIEKKYSYLGQKGYSPRLLLRILFYAYAIGERSGRRIASLCETDTAFMYLANMYRPNFRTINDFRKDNIEFIKDAFIQIVRLCKSLGMVKMGSITVDGTKLKANANSTHSRTKQGYEKWIKELDAQIDQILKEASQTDQREDREHGKDNRGDQVPSDLVQKEKLREKIKKALSKFKSETSKERINLTDVEAKIIKGNGRFDTNYNCQIAISEDDIIIGAYTSNNSSDRSETKTIVESVEKNTEQKVKEIIADSGYASYDHYEYLEGKGVKCYMPDQQWKTETKKALNPYHRNHFKYDKVSDTFTCPEGKTLSFTNHLNHKKFKQQSKVYACKDCTHCNKKLLCTKGKFRTIHLEKREHLRDRIRKRLLTQSGKIKYITRMRIEAVFGNIKHNLNYKHLYLSGLKKTTAEWQLICIGYNIRKIHLNRL